MLVIKNGMIHKCNTKERYDSFLASGWKPFKPEMKTKVKKQTKPKE